MFVDMYNRLFIVFFRYHSFIFLGGLKTIKNEFVIFLVFPDSPHNVRRTKYRYKKCGGWRNRHRTWAVEAISGKFKYVTHLVSTIPRGRSSYCLVI